MHRPQATGSLRHSTPNLVLVSSRLGWWTPTDTAKKQYAQENEGRQHCKGPCYLHPHAECGNGGCVGWRNLLEVVRLIHSLTAEAESSHCVICPPMFRSHELFLSWYATVSEVKVYISWRVWSSFPLEVLKNFCLSEKYTLPGCVYVTFFFYVGKEKVSS